MWVIATYQSTSLFSLKPATATASGGRTLLVPTPYAIKMALLDVACLLVGQATAAAAWDSWLGNCQVALRPADDVVVNNTFIKILRPPKSPEPGQPFQSTIAYREYAYIAGDFGIALAVNTDEQANAIKHWFAHINYLGKRGSFIQLQYMPNVVDELTSENGWVIVGQFPTEGLPLDAVFTQLDDTTEQATFERVNIYSAGKIELGKHRVLHPVALPYVRVKSSRGYTHYRRRDDP